LANIKFIVPFVVCNVDKKVLHNVGAEGFEPPTLSV
jgi:hypothetical protein